MERADPLLRALGVAAAAFALLASAAPARGSEQQLVARAAAPRIAVFASPTDARPKLVLMKRNWLGTRRTFLVRERTRGWLRVLLPIRPNGSSGWIRARSVRLVRTRVHAVAVLGARRLTVRREGAVVAHFGIAIGKRSTPTPTGEFFVTDSLRIRGRLFHSYGPWALGLSGYSDVFRQFAGGPAQIAIHGTSAPWTVGRAASFGCLRVRNPDIVRLARLLPVGTPVTIVP